MRRNRVLRKFIALLLISVTITLSLNRFYQRIEFFEELQIAFSHMASLSACDEGAEQVLKDFKRPKYSFFDYNSFFSASELLPIYRPTIACLRIFETFQALPEVYPEIDVPPQNFA